MKKILIINDNNDLQDILSLSLSYGGYKIVHAVNGKQVFELAERDKPEVIILNAKMHSMDSFEVCKQLKTLPELTNSFLIILNATAKLSDKTKYFEVGANYYMAMPFDSAELIAVLSGVRAK